MLDYLFVRQMSEIRHEGKGDCCTLRLLTNLFTGLTVYAGFPLQVNAFYYKENHGMCECDVTICNFNKQYFILGNSHGTQLKIRCCVTPFGVLICLFKYNTPRVLCRVRYNTPKCVNHEYVRTCYHSRKVLHMTPYER